MALWCVLGYAVNCCPRGLLSAIPYHLGLDVTTYEGKTFGVRRILHHEAVSDSEYVELYYDPSTRILNKGGITLVSKDFFPFGYMLLRSIRNSFTKEDLKQHGNQSIKKAFSKIEAEKGFRFFLFL